MFRSLTLAGCIILNEANDVLLIHRNTPRITQWETPGGKVEDGENPEEAAFRELREELGIEVKIIRELGRREFFEEEKKMDYFWYLASIVSGKPDLLEKDIFDGINYFSWDELSTMKSLLSPNTKNLVDAYFAGELNLSLGKTLS